VHGITEKERERERESLQDVKENPVVVGIQIFYLLIYNCVYKVKKKKRKKL
jgi:hypothetical protein